jgi:DNA-binding MarR family transcriptional regulator
MLTIASNLSLPNDAVTQTFAILAKRGVGKTYTASVAAEEMLAAGYQIVAIDPTGAWWGLRSKYPVVVFGGEHGDLPLSEPAGETVARAIVEGRFSAVIDLSLFRKGEAMRFMVGFAESLYRINREALHLFVDEADTVAPQVKLYGGDENRLLGAMEDIVRRGRKRGIGCTLITQRPAVLNKNVLTQCECLVALRLVHHRDIDAIKEWVSVHGDPTTAKEMIESLPSLPVGEAWFWAPAWDDLFRRVKVRKRHTFDSGATPKPGEKPAAPPKLTPVDLNALGERIRAADEQRKANDQATLRAEIARLKKELAAKPAAAADPAMLEAEYRRGVEDERKRWGRGLNGTQADLVKVAAVIGKAVESLRSLTGDGPANAVIVKPLKMEDVQLRPIVRPTRAAAGPGEALPKGEKAILAACAQYPGGADRTQLTILTGYKRSSRDAYIQRLREKGYIDSSGDAVAATEAGVDALGADFDPLPTGDALREHWLGRLPEGEKKILAVLIDRYPNAVARDELDEATGYKRSSRDAYLRRLSARKLVEAERGEVKASGILF